jgi:predicted PurR-regulated permease PerM
MVVIQSIIDEIQEEIDYFTNYQILLQKWIVRKKHKNSKVFYKFMEEFKTIIIHIAFLEEKKREYEKLLRRIYKL